jgi:DNA replication ATP-dependent helicase Dna2
LSQTKKTNLHEAEMIGKLVESYHEIYQKNGRELTAKCIGIITPYRAQIAQIQEVLQAKDFDCSFITIDTVERYQGGARDIILVSLCTNSLRQVDKLVSLSEEGVDRKLNVALTRAREHVVVVGNADLLGQNAIYGNLIREFAKS